MMRAIYYPRLVGEILVEQLQSGAKYTTVSACEIDARKQKFISEFMFQDSSKCVYTDIANVGNCAAFCSVHGKTCPIKVPSDKLNICVCGFSCKYLSKLNMKFLKKDAVLSKGVGPARSHSTG